MTTSKGRNRKASIPASAQTFCHPKTRVSAKVAAYRLDTLCYNAALSPGRSFPLLCIGLARLGLTLP
jgi:hypothetical protein